MAGRLSDTAPPRHLGVVETRGGLAYGAGSPRLIDGVQWLDQGSADALLFTARRFQADAMAVLSAVPESSARFPAPGLPTPRTSSGKAAWAT